MKDKAYHQKPIKFDYSLAQTSMTYKEVNGRQYRCGNCDSVRYACPATTHAPAESADGRQKPEQRSTYFLGLSNFSPIGARFKTMPAYDEVQNGQTENQNILLQNKKIKNKRLRTESHLSEADEKNFNAITDNSLPVSAVQKSLLTPSTESRAARSRKYQYQLYQYDESAILTPAQFKDLLLSRRQPS